MGSTANNQIYQDILDKSRLSLKTFKQLINETKEYKESIAADKSEAREKQFESEDPYPFTLISDSRDLIGFLIELKCA